MIESAATVRSDTVGIPEVFETVNAKVGMLKFETPILFFVHIFIKFRKPVNNGIILIHWLQVFLVE